MKTTSKKYRNTAFLIELMVNVLVFSISCAILVGLFGKAGQLSRKTKEETQAANTVLSLVETVKAQGTGGIVGAEADAGEYILYYDSEWQLTADENAPYKIDLHIGQQEKATGTLYSIQATALAQDSGRELYSVETAAYAPNTEGGAAL